MSLLQRQPRPLKRDKEGLRDDRLFIVGCDDTYAPEQYFGFFKIPRIQVKVIPTTDGTSVAQQVLDRLIAFDHEPDDEIWMLLDTDHCTRGTHLKSFLPAIKEAQRKGVKVALSKPCFEIWLLLHHADEANIDSHTVCAGVEEALRAQLGGYNKTNLKAEHFPMASLAAACARAQRRDASVLGGDIPIANTTRGVQTVAGHRRQSVTYPASSGT